MSLPVVLRLEARTEFDEAYDWYEEQRPGLGSDFTAEIQKVLDRIGSEPELFERVFEDVRRAVARRFPYSILFQVEPRQVVVLAVFHSKRDPQTWRTRV